MRTNEIVRKAEHINVGFNWCWYVAFFIFINVHELVELTFLSVYDPQVPKDQIQLDLSMEKFD